VGLGPQPVDLLPTDWPFPPSTKVGGRLCLPTGSMLSHLRVGQGAGWDKQIGATLPKPTQLQQHPGHARRNTGRQIHQTHGAWLPRPQALVCTSTSGAAPMTAAQRLEPYQLLADELAQLPWPGRGPLLRCTPA